MIYSVVLSHVVASGARQLIEVWNSEQIPYIPPPGQIIRTENGRRWMVKQITAEAPTQLVDPASGTAIERTSFQQIAIQVQQVPPRD